MLGEVVKVERGDDVDEPRSCHDRGSLKSPLIRRYQLVNSDASLS